LFDFTVLANPDHFRQQVAVATDISMLIELGKKFVDSGLTSFSITS
jgi:hypothetical protein